jgi:hypothetical protein
VLLFEPRDFQRFVSIFDSENYNGRKGSYNTEITQQGSSLSRLPLKHTVHMLFTALLLAIQSMVDLSFFSVL